LTELGEPLVAGKGRRKMMARKRKVRGKKDGARNGKWNTRMKRVG